MSVHYRLGDGETFIHVKEAKNAAARQVVDELLGDQSLTMVVNVVTEKRYIVQLSDLDEKVQASLPLKPLNAEKADTRRIILHACDQLVELAKVGLDVPENAVSIISRRVLQDTYLNVDEMQSRVNHNVTKNVFNDANGRLGVALLSPLPDLREVLKWGIPPTTYVDIIQATLSIPIEQARQCWILLTRDVDRMTFTAVAFNVNFVQQVLDSDMELLKRNLVTELYKELSRLNDSLEPSQGYTIPGFLIENFGAILNNQGVTFTNDIFNDLRPLVFTAQDGYSLLPIEDSFEYNNDSSFPLVVKHPWNKEDSTTLWTNKLPFERKALFEKQISQDTDKSEFWCITLFSHVFPNVSYLMAFTTQDETSFTLCVFVKIVQ
jgi:hypothetical protein